LLRIYDWSSFEKDMSEEANRRRKAERDQLSYLQRVCFLLPFLHHWSLIQITGGHENADCNYRLKTWSISTYIR
jgi:hypothetical protein